MKKILYIVTQSEFGGAQRFVFNMATNLDKTKYDVMVAAGPQGDSENGLLHALDKQKIKTGRLKHLKRAIGCVEEYRAYNEIKRLIDEFQPDIVQLGSSKAGIIGSIAAYYARKKPLIIYRIGGFAFNDEPSWFKRKIYLWAECFAQYYRDILVLNSEYEQNMAVKKGLPQPEKIHVIHNGVDLKNLKFFNQETARDVLERLAGGKISLGDKKVIGTAAHFYPAKDIPTFIRTAKEVSRQKDNVFFVIIGDGYERENVVKLIKKLKIQDRVFLAGSITPASQYFKAFDIFLLTSTKEGSPWTVFEAMAAGLPIVSTRVAGVPEVVRDQKNGLLAPLRSPKLLAEKIIEILDNPELTEKFSQKNLQDIRKYTVEKMIAQFEELYNEI